MKNPTSLRKCIFFLKEPDVMWFCDSVNMFFCWKQGGEFDAALVRWSVGLYTSNFRFPVSPTQAPIFLHKCSYTQLLSSLCLLSFHRANLFTQRYCSRVQNHFFPHIILSTLFFFSVILATLLATILMYFCFVLFYCCFQSAFNII